MFDSHQEQLCSRHGETELVRAMSRGTLECIRDCQRQFSNSQWNCTTFNGEYLFGRFVENGMSHTLPHTHTHAHTHTHTHTHSLTPTLPLSFTATRETAILNAFLSAGATHGIASACHKNTLEGCPCIADPAERIDGITYLRTCSDNIEFAIRFMKDFYDIEESTSEEDLVNKWNNELGYEVNCKVERE